VSLIFDKSIKEFVQLVKSSLDENCTYFTKLPFDARLTFIEDEYGISISVYVKKDIA